MINLYNLFSTYNDTLYFKTKIPYTLLNNADDKDATECKLNNPIYCKPSKNNGKKFVVLDTKPFEQGHFGAITNVLVELIVDEENKTVKATLRNKCVKKQYHTAGRPVAAAFAEYYITQMLAPYLHMKEPVVISQFSGDDDMSSFDLKSGEELTLSLLAMKKLKGNDLFDATTDKIQNLDIHSVFQIAFSIINGVTKLHEMDYIHRDIKPENILLNVDKKKARIIDFGMSQPKDAVNGILSGTSEYHDPSLMTRYDAEGISKDNPANLYSRQSDNYALGMTLIRLFLSSTLPDTDMLEVIELLEKLTQLDPADRYTLDRVHNELNELAQRWPEREMKQTKELPEASTKTAKIEKKLRQIIIPCAFFSSSFSGSESEGDSDSDCDYNDSDYVRHSDSNSDSNGFERGSYGGSSEDEKNTSGFLRTTREKVTTKLSF